MVTHIEMSVNEIEIEQLSSNVFKLENVNELIICLQLIEIGSPNIHFTLHNNLFEILDKLSILLCHPFKAVC